MFRPNANLGLRLARTVVIPYGPLIVSIVLGSLGVGSEGLYGVLIPVSLGWFFCALLIVSVLSARHDGSPGSSDDDGGGGRPPESPPRKPDPGGIPLPDAEQSRERVRDHARGKHRGLRRRTVREPQQTPSRR